MQTKTISERLHPTLFIGIYKEAKTLAPPRFLTLRLHPDRYAEIYKMAEVPESIQMGNTPGPLGKQIMRVACIKPPMGVGDGMAVIQDPNCGPDTLTFEIHGVPELIIEGLLYDSPTQSTTSSSVNKKRASGKK